MPRLILDVTDDQVIDVTRALTTRHIPFRIEFPDTPVETLETVIDKARHAPPGPGPRQLDRRHVLKTKLGQLTMQWVREFVVGESLPVEDLGKLYVDHSYSPNSVSTMLSQLTLAGSIRRDGTRGNYTFYRVEEDESC